MTRTALLLTKCDLFYSLIGFTVLLATLISQGKCQELKYSPEGCKNETGLSEKCPDKDKPHTFSEEFFMLCREKLENYDIKLSPGPFDPEEACLIFEDLSSVHLCIDIKEYKDAVRGGIAALILIIILDIAGVGIILYTVIRDCIKPHPPPPPTPSQAPSQPPSAQPTVVIVQTAAAAPAAAAPTADAKPLAKDEEKGPN